MDTAETATLKESWIIVTAAPLVIAQSAGAAKGIQPPAPAKAPYLCEDDKRDRCANCGKQGTG